MKLKNVHNDFNYTFQKRLDSKEKITLEIPVPQGKAKSIKSISWQVAPDVKVYATLATHYKSIYTQWEELKANAQVSTSVTAIKFENTTSNYKELYLWVVME